MASRINWKIFWIVVAVVGTLLVGGFTYHRLMKNTTDTKLTDGGVYAVFLSNGQVYFGSITEQRRDFLVLRDIFYIQVKNGEEKSPTVPLSDAALLKLGNELHGPEDWMQINMEHVLFVEKLKENGKVAQAIKSYQQQK